jgi:dolichyl-diphosphooligosaccharide--protein glycosyltransferase
MGKNTKKTAESSSNYLFGLVWLGAAIYGVYFALGWAYKIRILALEGYGYVIHEFDPYFNYRATEVCSLF